MDDLDSLKKIIQDKKNCKHQKRCNFIHGYFEFMVCKNAVIAKVLKPRKTAEWW